MKIPILTFHAWRKGSGFAENDHTALDEVLHTLTAQKIAVVPLHRAVAALSNPFVRWRLPTRAVALTCDDGDVSEVESSVSDTGEKIPSFAEILENHAASQRPIGGHPHITSFVIASAAARAQIAPDGALAGKWWQTSLANGRHAIENHSWDHCHDAVSTIAQHSQQKGTFIGVDNYTDASRQIRDASVEINAQLGNNRTSLFAYPYGPANDYLVREYMPNYKHEHGMKAAFSCEAKPMERSDNRWNLPRFVMGWHIKSADELSKLCHDTWE